MRTPLIALVLALSTLPGVSWAQRQIHFQQGYASRCPGDRTGALITVRNIGITPQTVEIRGGVRIMAGDGACGQSYGSLSIAPNYIPQTFAIWSTFDGVASSTTKTVLQPNGVVQFLCATPTPGGGSGSYAGSVVIEEDRGVVQASGVVWSPQDTAALPPLGWPNYVFSSTFDINGSRPF